MASKSSQLEEEIESWKGFPWVLRKDDLEQWNSMIKEVTEGYAGAVEKSGKESVTDPFFMALLLAQQKTIRRLQTVLRSFGIEMPGPSAVEMTLDRY